MKTLIKTLSLLLIYINSSFALSINDIPDEFNIIQNWISLTSSYEIETQTQKLGILYQKFFSLLLTYEFFDPYDNKLATAYSKFFSLTAHDDVYDKNEGLLGVAEEKLFAFYPTFDIYAKDTVTQLANAEMNFWGTTFSIYDPETNQEMAIMHRSFFSVKNDWTFTIINRPLLNKKNIDPRVLLTVIAFQGDRESWESGLFSNSLRSADTKFIATPRETNIILEKINNIYKQEGFAAAKSPDAKLLEEIITELEISYQNNYVTSLSKPTNQEKVINFTEYCLALAQENGISDSRKQAILYLLKTRLERAKL